MGFVPWWEAWPVMQGKVREMLERGRGDGLSEEIIRQGLQSCQFAVVGAEIDGEIEGCAIIEFQSRPQGRCLYVLGMFGVGMDRWFDAGLDFLDELMERNHCYCVETQARTGSAARLLQRGWRQKAILMERRNGRAIST